MSFSCDKVDGIHETEVESSESSLQEDILYNTGDSRWLELRSLEVLDLSK